MTEAAIASHVNLTEAADSPDLRTSTGQSQNDPMDAESIPQYEDPYKKAVEYMERHQILHIFREITEHMVFSRPNDPLQFMLKEVESLMKERERKVADMLTKNKS